MRPAAMLPVIPVGELLPFAERYSAAHVTKKKRATTADAMPAVAAPAPTMKTVEPSPSEVAARRKAFDRLRLLTHEVDLLVEDAAERTQSIASKASFLAVSAGVLIAALTAQIWTQQTILALIALILA